MQALKSTKGASQEMLQIRPDPREHECRSVEGLWLRQQAAEARVLRRGDPSAAGDAQTRADQLDAQAAAILDIGRETKDGADQGKLSPGPPQTGFRGTLHERPDRVAVDAGRQRLSLAGQVGATALAADAEASVRAENSLEIMLSHQLAAAHLGAMEMQSRALDVLKLYARSPDEHGALCADAARLSNAAARLMAASQGAMIVLNRLRNKGVQHVVVKHLHVEAGGRAIVAGDVQAGGGSR